MKYKFKIKGALSAETFSTRDAAFAAGLLKAGVLASVQTVGVKV